MRLVDFVCRSARPINTHARWPNQDRRSSKNQTPRYYTRARAEKFVGEEAKQNSWYNSGAAAAHEWLPRRARRGESTSIFSPLYTRALSLDRNYIYISGRIFPISPSVDSTIMYACRVEDHSTSKIVPESVDQIGAVSAAGSPEAAGFIHVSP